MIDGSSTTECWIGRLECSAVIAFSAGGQSVFPVLRESAVAGVFSTRVYKLPTECGAVAIDMNRSRDEAMRSPSSALSPVPDRMDPCC